MLFSQALLDEKSLREMAFAFNVSIRILQTYLFKLRVKLKVRTNVGLVLYAAKNELV